MTTRVRKHKFRPIDEPLRSMYISYANKYAASFLGASMQLGKQYVVENALTDRMMVWSFITRMYSVPSSKEYAGGANAPYIRITKLYDNFKAVCSRYKMEPCSFRFFKTELIQNLELCFTRRGAQHAIYLVGCQHPAYQNEIRGQDVNCDIFQTPLHTELWHIFGKKPYKKGDNKIDIKYKIKGGKEICIRKKFMLVGGSI